MKMKNSIRVLCVDDHELLRKGIRFSMLAIEDIELIAEAHTGKEAISICEEYQPDVVIMDMILGGDMDGITTTRILHERFPNIQILALSSFYDHELVNGAMQAGAVGYQIKGGSIEELANAIRAAHNGQTTLAGEAARVLFVKPKRSYIPGSDLTERELEVLTYLVEGLSNPQIAEHMHLSIAAVKYHVSSILTKLGVENRTMAVKLAYEHNLVHKER